MGIWYDWRLAFGSLIVNVDEAIEKFYVNNDMSVDKDQSLGTHVEIVNKQLVKSGYPFELIYGRPYYECENRLEITVALVLKGIDGTSISVTKVKELFDTFDYELMNNCLAEFDLDKKEPEFLSILDVC